MRNLLDMVGRNRSRSAGARHNRHFSLIDFGTDTVKAVVVQKERTGVRVLGYGFSPAEGRDLSSSRRADVAAMAAMADAALVAAEDQTDATGQGKVVPDEALFCIPARLTRGEFFEVRQTRSAPAQPIATHELKNVWERVERLARERLPSLGDEGFAWKPLAVSPGPITVDGHQVTDPVGLKGRDLWLSAYGVAVWPSSLRAAEAIAERLELTLINVVATAQSLVSIVPQREAILLDIGAKGTSLHLIQDNALISTTWWSQGGEFFTQSLCQAFHCLSEEAEALKRAYADDALSRRDNDLVTQSLVKPVNAWLEMLVARLDQMATRETGRRPVHIPPDSNRTSALPGRIYLTGGGSLLPDLSQALSWLEANPSLSFRRSLEIESLGFRLGARTPGRLALLDVPPNPISDLLTPTISLATCLE